MGGELHVDVRVRDHSALLFTSTAPAIGVVGPSGAGKSTLLRVLAGVERRAVGTVRALGETWLSATDHVPPWRRGVGWVPQDSVLFPHLNVWHNLSYSGRSSASDVTALAAELGLAALLERSPRNLSGGERQRVALGRALLSRPRLLLLDEPFAALDRVLRVRLANAVARLCRERALPVLLVSHDGSDFDGFEAERWTFEGGALSRE